MNSAKTEAEVIARRISDHLHAPAWTQCPSTHCERSQECRSPNECSGTGAGWVYREVYAAIMTERRAGEDLAQMLVQRDQEADEALIAAARQLAIVTAERDARAEEHKALAYHPDGELYRDLWKMSCFNVGRVAKRANELRADGECITKMLIDRERLADEQHATLTARNAALTALLGEAKGLLIGCACDCIGACDYYCDLDPEVCPRRQAHALIAKLNEAVK